MRPFAVDFSVFGLPPYLQIPIFIPHHEWPVHEIIDPVTFRFLDFVGMPFHPDPLLLTVLKVSQFLDQPVFPLFLDPSRKGGVVFVDEKHNHPVHSLAGKFLNWDGLPNGMLEGFGVS